MSARWLLSAALAVLTASPAAAQDAAGLADRFERALVAGDYRDLPLTEDFAYTENGARLDPWNGMWRTLTAVEGAVDHPELDYRVELVDGEAAVRVVEFVENTVHGVMAYRLVARDGQIASVDLLLIREEFGGDRGGTLTLLQPMLPLTMDGALVGPADPLFAQSLAPGELEGMDGVLEFGPRAFFDELGAGPAPFLWSEDCRRRDNGHLATGVADSPLLDPAMPAFRPYALSCRDQLASGFYANFRPAHANVYRDPTRGLAIAFVRLDQPGTVLSFTTPDGTRIAYPGPRGAVAGADTGEQFDGRILTNMITPMSVNGVFLFRFNADVKIERIDAFYRGAPLGWDAVPD